MGKGSFAVPWPAMSALAAVSAPAAVPAPAAVSAPGDNCIREGLVPPPEDLLLWRGQLPIPVPWPSSISLPPPAMTPPVPTLAAVGDILVNAIETMPELVAPGTDVPAVPAADTHFFKINAASSNGELVCNDASSHGMSSAEEHWHLIGSQAGSATMRKFAGDVRDSVCSVPCPFPWPSPPGGVL